MTHFLTQLYADYYHSIIATCCCTFFALCAGALGTIAYLKRHSMLADTLSHATLPGVVCALMLTVSGSSGILSAGAIISAALAMGSIQYLKQTTKLQTDTLFAVILSSYLGFGLLLISILQKFPRADQGLINKFLFGNASLALSSDLLLIVIIGISLLLSMTLFFKELIMGIFDETFSQTIGFSASRLSLIYNILLIGIIALGIQTVGIILLSSQLIMPSVVARQWTYNTKPFVLLASCIGAATALLGSLISFYARTPTGPTICVILFITVVSSLIARQPKGPL